MYDPKKIKLNVDIDTIRPNVWNPKDDGDTKEYQRIRRSIQKKGLRIAIYVRYKPQDDGTLYEIIDGEQRWRICKELEYKKVVIYNEGEISDQEAKELTLAFEQQVPFNDVTLAGLIKQMKADYADLELPYDDQEIESMLNLNEFDWNSLNDKILGDSPMSDYSTLTARILTVEFNDVKAEIERIMSVIPIDEDAIKEIKYGQALVKICDLVSTIPLSDLQNANEDDP